MQEEIAADGARSVQMRSRILRVRFVQELRRHDACAAVIEDPMVDLRFHGAEIAVPLIGSRVAACEGDEMNLELAKSLHQSA
jgi:hypothetical protein